MTGLRMYVRSILQSVDTPCPLAYAVAHHGSKLPTELELIAEKL